MPPTLQIIDPALLGKLKSGDEPAFERLFRERYAALVEEAKTILDGDGAAAARGVENVFVQVWGGRESVTTPEAFEQFLRAAVHESAARIKGRRVAAHRFGDHEGGKAKKVEAKPAPSVDEAWSKIYGALHIDAAHAADVAHEMADHSRHEAAAQLTEIAKPRSKVPMIVGALLILCAIGGVAWWANRGRAAAELTAALASSEARMKSTGAAELQNVTLGEGSTVVLGPDSKLRIPQKFGPTIRGLKLDGTATFTVAPGLALPFVVRAGNTTITATGTEFSVRAYPDEHDVLVRVREGGVNVTVGDSIRPLAKGAALLVSRDSTMRDATEAEVEQWLGWTDGTLVVNDRPLREVLAVAKRWYGLDLFVPDTALLSSRKASLRAKIDAPKDAIASIETSGGLRKGWEGSNMVLRDVRKKK
jgi:transmembrane sensor